LGIGADADITVYNPDPNYETMFSWPQMVIKAGQVLIENGEFRQFVRGDLLCVQPDYDREQGVAIEKWFDDNYSIPWSAID
jgi:formylmethanofuran dehydrogenase subunit A